MVPILVILAIVAFVAVDIVVQAVARRREAATTLQTHGAVEANHHFTWNVEVPAGYFLSKGHTWGRVEKDGGLVAGMDDFARQMLGTPDTVELPKVGTALRAGEPMATLYRKGRLAHVPAPADGVVEDVHANVILHPTAVSKDPYGEGWMVRLRPANLGKTLSHLKVAEEAQKFQTDEVVRMRAFLDRYPAAAVAADGGTPVEGIVGVLGTDAWDSFRRDFLHETI